MLLSNRTKGHMYAVAAAAAFSCGLLSLVMLAKYFHNLPFWLGMAFFYCIQVCLSSVMPLLAKADYYHILAKDQDNKSRGAREKLIDIIEKRKPFALYLRSHSIERGSTILAKLPDDKSIDRYLMGGVRPMPVFAPWINNCLENSIVDPIAEYIPVFSLASPKDEAGGNAYRILVQKDEWWNMFNQAATYASLIIIVVEQLSPGIAMELKKISMMDNKLRLFLVCDAQIEADLEQKFRLSKEEVPWLIRINRHGSGKLRDEYVQVPNALIEYVRRLAEIGPVTS